MKAYLNTTQCIYNQGKEKGVKMVVLSGYIE